MKRKTIYMPIMAVMIAAFAINLSATTNVVFITDERLTHYEETIQFTPAQMEHARGSKESRPSEADPEGNWGEVTEGFQLSIRLEKEVFTNGEPVNATVILRNVSGRPLKYEVMYGADDGIKLNLLKGESRVAVTNNPTGTNFLDRLRTIRSGSMGIYTSPPGTQRKFTKRIDQGFDLTSTGGYVVTAKRTVPSTNAAAFKNAVSGSARFRIADPVSGGDTNTPSSAPKI